MIPLGPSRARASRGTGTGAIRGLRPRSFVLALALLLACGCGVREQAANSAVVDVEAEYARMRVDAERVDPAQAAVIEDELEAARQAVDRRDFESAARTARVLSTRLRELRIRLEIAERRARLATEDTAPDSNVTRTEGARGEAGAARATPRRSSR